MESLQKKRFSVRASTLVASARRKSTRAVYDARWKLFSNWCIRVGSVMLLCQPGFLAKINFPLWLLNPSTFQVFLKLVDMKMMIDFFARSGR
ncbi:hypothetical protein DPMN_084724 [Dreissena polymorpha]|uniref:Uncharacterized protein n=1 Tax=Dreissena polymorpha TaxID=45954 RepID=A0A9D3YF30_DREPO|nr:hypothetical protein DPMN_084724 [Dreissena polymorpha]